MESVVKEKLVSELTQLLGQRKLAQDCVQRFGATMAENATEENVSDCARLMFREYSRHLWTVQVRDKLVQRGMSYDAARTVLDRNRHELSHMHCRGVGFVQAVEHLAVLEYQRLRPEIGPQLTALVGSAIGAERLVTRHYTCMLECCLVGMSPDQVVVELLFQEHRRLVLEQLAAKIEIGKLPSASSPLSKNPQMKANATKQATAYIDNYALKMRGWFSDGWDVEKTVSHLFAVNSPRRRPSSDVLTSSIAYGE